MQFHDIFVNVAGGFHGDLRIIILLAPMEYGAFVADKTRRVVSILYTKPYP